MNTKRRIIWVLLITIILSILITSCELSNVKFGEVRLMYGSNEDGRIAYDITTFTGTESGSLQAEQGQAIAFTYQADLDKGSLVIEWQDPHGEVVWRKELVEDIIGDENFEIISPGEYTVFIQGKGAGGSFDVSWQIN